MRAIHSPARVLAASITAIKRLSQEFKVLLFWKLDRGTGGQSHGSNGRLLLRFHHFMNLLWLHFLLQFCFLDLLRHGLRSQMEHSIAPVLLVFILLCKLVHGLLGNRFAEVVLKIVVVHNTGYFLVFLGELGRGRTKSEVRIVLDEIGQIAF